MSDDDADGDDGEAAVDSAAADDSDTSWILGQGDDDLVGSGGDDWASGGKGDDVVRGGVGNDFLSGDLGNDVLTGGTGADRFYIFGGAGVDRVTDFSHAEGDKLTGVPNRVKLDEVMAHELAHVKNRDTLIMTVTASIAGARMQILDRCGHWTTFERPAEVNTALVNFLVSL